MQSEEISLGLELKGLFHSVFNLWGQKHFPLVTLVAQPWKLQDFLNFLNFQLGLGGFWRHRSV